MNENFLYKCPNVKFKVLFFNLEVLPVNIKNTFSFSSDIRMTTKLSYYAISIVVLLSGLLRSSLNFSNHYAIKFIHFCCQRVSLQDHWLGCKPVLSMDSIWKCLFYANKISNSCLLKGFNNGHNVKRYLHLLLRHLNT